MKQAGDYIAFFRWLLDHGQFRMAIQVIRLSGQPTEISYQLGKIRAARIQKRIDYWNREISRLYHGRRSELASLEKNFLVHSRREAPGYLEEIVAMAEGAGVAFPDLFRLNLTELNAFAEKCSDLILPFRKDGPKVMIAHNEDWNPKRNDLFVLVARLPKVSFFTLAYDGYLPGLSAGFNSYGLIHSVNYLNSRDMRPGLPRIFVTRRLLDAVNPKAWLSFAGTVHRAFAQSVHLAQEGRYWNFELSARTISRRRPQLPTAHTNHFLTPRLRSLENSQALGSTIRYRTALGLLAKNWPRKAVNFAKAKRVARQILSDRSSHPFALWRKPTPPQELSATLATVILRSDRLSAEVYRDRPDSAFPLLIQL